MGQIMKKEVIENYLGFISTPLYQQLIFNFIIRKDTLEVIHEFNKDLNAASRVRAGNGNKYFL